MVENSGTMRLTIGTSARSRDEAGDENLRRILRRNLPRLLDRHVAHRRHLEIFAAEQIGVGDDQRDGADAEETASATRQIDDEHEEAELQRRSGSPARSAAPCPAVVRIVAALDEAGDAVEIEAGEQRRHRRTRKEGQHRSGRGRPRPRSAFRQPQGTSFSASSTRSVPR